MAKYILEVYNRDFLCQLVTNLLSKNCTRKVIYIIMDILKKLKWEIHSSHKYLLHVHTFHL